MLSNEEKENLHNLIIALVGKDISISQSKQRFNDQTVAVVEKMLKESIDCNTAMKMLVVELLGTSVSFTKGWLKRLLKASKFTISKSTFDGYGCRVSLKAKWKSAILISVI